MCLYTPALPSVPEMEDMYRPMDGIFFCGCTFGFLYPVFTHMLGGVTLGDSGLLLYRYLLSTVNFFSFVDFSLKKLAFAFINDGVQ